jgi:hypothetical protein
MPEFMEEIVYYLPVHQGRGEARSVVAHAVVLHDAYTLGVLVDLNWRLSDKGYVQTNVKQGSKWITRRLHQMVYEQYLGRLDTGQEIDHEDRNKLNNLPSNLRPAASGINKANQGKRDPDGCTSRYKCVCWNKTNGMWEVQVKRDGKNHRIGFFDNEELAAAKANEAYREMYPGVEVPNPGVGSPGA